MRGVRGENGEGGMERNEDLNGVAKICREFRAFILDALKLSKGSFSLMKVADGDICKPTLLTLTINKNLPSLQTPLESTAVTASVTLLL